MRIVLASLLVVTCYLSSAQGTVVPHGQNFVCYYTNWAQYRPGKGKFLGPEHVDPFLCTHIVFSFIEIGADSRLKLREWNDADTISKLLQLKTSNPSLLFTAAVGGWNFGTEAFTEICKTELGMRNFANDAVVFLKTYGFDGLDMDWEYPGSRGSPPEDKQRFTRLLEILRETFEANKAPHTPRLLLTAAVAAGQPTIDAGYEIEKVCNLLDLVHLMAYDLHGAWETRTDHNAAVYSVGGVYSDGADEKNFYVKYALDYWLDNGCSSDKMVLGIPTYGRGYTLTDPSVYGYGAAASDSATAGTYTREAGFLSFYEICDLTGTHVYNDKTAAPVLVSGDQWIGYDNVTSVIEKTKLLQSYDLAGAMIWALDLDDFGGFCVSTGHKKYVLSNAIKEQLDSTGNGGSSSTTTTTTVGNGITSSSTTKATTDSTTTTSTTTTAGSSSGNICATEGDGYHVDPVDPNKYHQCNGAQHWEFRCGAGLVFDETIHACTYP